MNLMFTLIIIVNIGIIIYNIIIKSNIILTYSIVLLKKSIIIYILLTAIKYFLKVNFPSTNIYLLLLHEVCYEITKLIFFVDINIQTLTIIVTENEILFSDKIALLFYFQSDSCMLISKLRAVVLNHSWLKSQYCTFINII